MTAKATDFVVPEPLAKKGKQRSKRRTRAQMKALPMGLESKTSLPWEVRMPTRASSTLFWSRSGWIRRS